MALHSAGVIPMRRANAVKCRHDPLVPKSSLVLESAPLVGTRIRCTSCGDTAVVTKRGTFHARMERWMGTNEIPEAPRE
jgi:hypothetical protein